MSKEFKKLTKKQSQDLFEEIIECIGCSKKGFFNLRKLRGVHGYCAWEDGIELDYRKDLVPTIIHECVHFIREDWSESQVCYAEKRIINAISEEDVILLLKMFCKKL